MLKNVNWKHVFGTALIIAAGIDQYLAGPQGAPLALEMHVSAAGLGLAGTIIILLQNSIKDPAAKVASDAAKKAAALRVVGSLLMLDETRQWLDLQASHGAGGHYIGKPRLSVADKDDG